MARDRHPVEEFDPAPPPRGGRWRRKLLVAGALALAALVLLVATWHAFFHYVPPGQMLVVIAKGGADLPAEQVLAEKGQKGIQREVLGEGWHFVMPVLYATELHPATVIEPNKVGVVTALGGKPLPEGRVLAEGDDEQGIRRHVLAPGVYRLNPYGYKVEQVEATEVRPGFVGVLRRLLGREGATRFADHPEEKGILRDVLQPGLYYVNTKEFEVIHCQIGIDQTTYRKDDHNSITFPARDGNTIAIDCTIEWEILPSDMPALVAEFGTVKDAKGRLQFNWHAAERNVIDQHARKISRDRGFNYGAQEYLEGGKREAFQADFQHELERVCREKNVVVRSAFIRNILIPDSFLQQKRERQLAVEAKVTAKAKQETAKSEADVERERSSIDKAVAKVEAETRALVAEVDRDVENLGQLTDAEVEKMKAEYGAKTAELDAERKRLLGEADAQVTKLKETAKGGLYKMKMDVFGNDGNAYLRYTLAEQLNPNLRLRLFHSGPGTFWTNLGDKNMSLLLPAPSHPPAPAEAKPAAEK
jgi:hypothetical protein